jgi:zinc transporter ZupT
VPQLASGGERGFGLRRRWLAEGCEEVEGREVKRAAMIFAGIVLMLAGLWGGAYATMSLFRFSDWQHFPAFMTALAAFAGGAVLIVAATHPR